MTLSSNAVPNDASDSGDHDDQSESGINRSEQEVEDQSVVADTSGTPFEIFWHDY